MFDQKIPLHHLSKIQLHRIIQESLETTEVPYFLFDTSGQLLLSSLGEDGMPGIPLTVPAENITKGCHQTALAVLDPSGVIQPAGNDCLIEVIEYEAEIYGVLVSWVGRLAEDSKEISFCKRLMHIAGRRVETLLRTQEEVNELSAEIVEDYRELALIHALSLKFAGVSEIEFA